MARRPRINKDEETARASHHKPVGRASMGAHTSCVTCAIDLSPSIKGGRSVSTTSAMLFFLALLVPVAYHREIPHGGPDIQFFQDSVATGVFHHLAHAAIRIVQVAKVNCFCRAGLLTGSLNGPVFDHLAASFGLDLGFLNTLHAEGAFLHDTA